MAEMDRHRLNAYEFFNFLSEGYHILPQGFTKRFVFHHTSLHACHFYHPSKNKKLIYLYFNISTFSYSLLIIVCSGLMPNMVPILKEETETPEREFLFGRPDVNALP